MMDNRMGVHTISHPSGLSAEILTVGASLQRLFVLDRAGHPVNVVLTLPNPEAYLANPSYIGCSVGRIANRVAGGRLEVDGVVHQLTQNEGTTSLHGGVDGWSFRDWEVVAEYDRSVTLELNSPDGDEGFPGAVVARCRYELSDGTLTATYEAVSDAPTVVNMTHHAYFNLSGDPHQPVADHVLCLDASHYALTDPDLTLTGDLAAVDGSHVDFRSPHGLADSDLAKIDTSILLDGDGLREVAELTHPGTGIRMTLATDQECLQFYAGSFLKGDPSAPFPRFAGVCLEPHALPYRQGLPNGGLPVLRPGATYSNTVVWRFDIA